MTQTRRFSVDESEYPFASHWFEQPGWAMHYVEEGAGIPIVMCHGNPTWSYLYRHIIKSLSPHYRCIAYDLPGFGFSGHPQNYGFTPQEQAQWVEALIFEHLKLDKFILVMQDWGGPIGLSIATRHHDRVLGMVISSTWAWKTNWIGKVFSGFMGSALGQYLILQRNFFAGTIVSMMLGSKATTQTKKAYTDPFPTPESRKGPAVFPVQIVAATPWLEQIESRLHLLRNKPVEFVFGLKDLLSTPGEIGKWLKHFPDAGVQKIAGANHFTQEDCPDNYVIAIRNIQATLDK